MFIITIYLFMNFVLKLPQNITVVEDHDQYSTDLMKCISALAEREKAEGMEVSPSSLPCLLSCSS